MASLRIASTRAQDLQAVATSGQAGLEAWQTLHALLTRELSAAHAALLAEPIVNDAQGTVDWYAEGSGPAARAQDLPGAERAAVQGTLDRLVTDIRGLAGRLAASRTGGAAQGDRVLAEILGAALELPGEEYLYARGGQPVLVGWGHRRSGGQGGAVRLTGVAAVAARGGAGMAILPPPPSPFALAPAPRRWPWAALALALLLCGAAAYVGLRDPFGWYAAEVPQCRVDPGQLALERGLQDEVAREGVLRTELAQLTADAGERRLHCAPVPAPVPEARAVPPPAPPPTPPPGEDQLRADRRGAQRGKLQLILAWDDVNDLDLHVVCPDGGDINYSRRSRCGGTLDVDANGDQDRLTPTPVENVYFNNPPPGHYRVVVDPYFMRNRQGSAFRVTLRRDGQPDRVVTGVAQDGQHMMVVLEFDVEADAGPAPGAPTPGPPPAGAPR